jgi:hypothetical protein
MYKYHMTDLKNKQTKNWKIRKLGEGDFRTGIFCSIIIFSKSDNFSKKLITEIYYVTKYLQKRYFVKKGKRN